MNFERQLSAKNEKLLGVPKKYRNAAIEILAFMRDRERLVYGIQMIMDGNFRDEVVRVAEVGQWLSPDYNGNAAHHFMNRLALAQPLEGIENLNDASQVARRTFKLLSPEEQRTLIAVITEIIAANRERFYENFPKQRPNPQI